MSFLSETLSIPRVQVENAFGFVESGIVPMPRLTDRNRRRKGGGGLRCEVRADAFSGHRATFAREIRFGDFSRIRGSHLYCDSRNDRAEGSGRPLSLAFPSHPSFSGPGFSLFVFSPFPSRVRASGGRHYLRIAERRRCSDSGFIALPTRRSPRAEAGIRYVVFLKHTPRARARAT